ncbi:4-coumarate--CoA ligase 2-like [Venturia canescens]|uniref:4-coumarate--CoA ligase 2-like n=1 Tax=Venturia canescens TaxID=32260 RepID=UPI001C9BC177|nr:4-coumarate--CoA ligase 2-like [Venturia canescens]XP_043282830.1 4-coumarate--CoA ligase 2-like [Venturia canescens]
MIRCSIKLSSGFSNAVFFQRKITRSNVKLYVRNRRILCASSARNSSTKANVDPNNVYRSLHDDVDCATGAHLHDYVWQNLDKWADKTAAVCIVTGRSYTYAQLRKASGRLATSLRKCNLNPGDTVAVVLPNVPEYAIVVFGASEAGIRLVPMSTAFTAYEIGIQLKNANASAVVTTPSKYATVATSVEGNREVKLPIIVVEDGSGEVPEGAIKFGDLTREDVEEFEKTGEKTGTEPEDSMLLPLSSGSTGLPKIVELSHRNVVANLKQLSVKGVALSTAATANWQENIPIILPLYHIYGLIVNLNLSMTVGAKMQFIPQFSAEAFFKVLKEARPTQLYLAPPLIQLMVNDPRMTKSHLESTKTLVCGAAPIGEEVITKYLKLAPSHTKILQGYGLTECSPVVTMSTESPFVSVGKPIPNTDIRVVGFDDENKGNNLSFDQVGEIYVRGPQVMKGYYNNPDATAQCMEGDWLKTGDLGSVDKSGYLYIRGRLKELIKVQGYQVAPAEIEDLIQGHEKVAEAAVIGVPHEKYGEVPKAFVVTKKGVHLNPEEIKNWIAERLAKYKHLGHVQFVDKIPKNPAGKILRRELEKM